MLCGIFVWLADVIAEAFRLYVTELADRTDGRIVGKDCQEDFASCPKIPIDCAVMEKVENVLVGRVDFYWNDLGFWSSLLSVLPLDDQGNAVRGKWRKSPWSLFPAPGRALWHRKKQVLEIKNIF